MGEANLIRRYIAEGLSVIPIVKGEKNPSCDWAKFQKKIATEDEVQDWKYPIALIGGVVSGGLVCIDFDDHGSRFADWFDSIRAEDEFLADLLVIQQTPSEGYHVIFRTQEEIRNGKLARLAERNSEGKIDLIETRGEGGYFLVAPSDGYILKQNDFFTIPNLTEDQVEILISNAKKFNLKAKEVSPDVESTNSEFGLSPFDSYDAKTSPVPLLEEFGWKVIQRAGEVVTLCRPGKERGVSATWNHIPGRFYVFTTNTDFENEHIYKPSAVYAILKHEGDFKKAAKDLFSKGYGEAKRFRIEANAEKEIILPYFSAKDFQADILRYRAEGAPPSESTGWHSLDRYYRVARGQLNVVTGIPSHGKALAIDTPIKTINGYKTLEDVHVGEIIFDQNGSQIKVIAETEIQYDRSCYRVEFDDGSFLIADEQHEWRTLSAKERRSKSNKKYFPITTKEISETMIDCGKFNHHIPVAGALNLRKKKLPIDPYLLGVWLGDGRSDVPSITKADRDIEIIERIRRKGYKIRKHLKSTSQYWIFGVTKIFRDIKILNDKHIPLIYLQSCIDDRLELLKGLMDTDGYSGKDSRCEFCTINETLAKCFLSLALSLGLRATLITGDATLDGRFISKKYRICFTANFPVFYLKRKLMRQRIGEKLCSYRNERRVIVSCKPCESVPVKCIQVSGTSKLYLAGKNLIPTHNSEILDNLTVNMAKNANWKFLFFSPENFPLEFHYQKLAEKFLDKSFMSFTKEENEAAISFIDSHYKFIMTNDQSVNVSCLLATANKILETERFDGFIIDPWNEIEPQRPAGMNETDFVSISLSMFRKFARKNNIATFIVAHPTKLKKEKNNDGKMAYAIPDLYSISGCYSEDTEVLTSEGWKRHIELKRDEQIATLNLESGGIEYNIPNDFIKKEFDGKLYNFTGYGYDLLVTPEHRLVVKANWKNPRGADAQDGIGRPQRWIKNKWVLCEAEKLPSAQFSIPLAPTKLLNGKKFSEDLSRLAGWYISEGTCISSGISLSQREGDNSDIIDALLNRLKIDFTKRLDPPGGNGGMKNINNWYIKYTTNKPIIDWLKCSCGIGSSNVHIPKEIMDGSYEDKIAFLDSYFLGDGSRRKKDGWRATTISRRLIDDIQIICLGIGRSSSFKIKKNIQSNHSDSYSIEICPSKRIETSISKKRNLSLVDYKGSVYCLNIKNGAYFVRRNGKICACGNSAHFYNKADNGITVWRDFERKITKVIIQKVKFKFYGSIGEVEFSYKHGSGIFEEVLSEEEKRLRELLKNENSYSF